MNCHSEMSSSSVKIQLLPQDMTVPQFISKIKEAGNLLPNWIKEKRNQLQLQHQQEPKKVKPFQNSNLLLIKEPQVLKKLF